MTSRRTGGTRSLRDRRTGIYLVGKGVGWYVDGGKRYVATTWPKKQFAWFDKKNVDHVVRQSPRRAATVRRATCNGCPATGGPGQAGTPSDSVVVFKAGGTGASSA